MKTRNTTTKLFVMATAFVMLATAFAVDAMAQQIECSGPSQR